MATITDPIILDSTGQAIVTALGGIASTLTPTDTVKADSVYPTETSPTTHAYLEGDHLIVDGITYIAIDNIAIGDSLTIGTNIQSETLGTRMNHIEDGIYDVSTKVEKKYTNTESYDFPKKASEISGSNDIYTVQNKGTAFLSYVFNSDTYSQFGFTVNDLYPVQGNITSGGKNLEGVRSTISFPVQAGDKIQVSFYSSYGVASLRLRVIY